MDPGYRSPLVDLFRRGEAEPSVRMLAAQGGLAPRAIEQVSLLLILADDADAAIASRARETLDGLPAAALRAFLARSDTPEEIRAFFAARGVTPADAPSEDYSIPLLEHPGDTTAGEEADGQDGDGGRVLSSLPIVERMKLAMKGTREQRAQLIRDSNRMVATAVLSSPKVNESEIEAFAKMGNVSEDVLRTIGTNRTWLKNYSIAFSLTKNAKTPPGISLQLLHRLNDKDVKAISTDRNVPEVLRMSARRLLVKGQK